MPVVRTQCHVLYNNIFCLVIIKQNRNYCDIRKINYYCYIRNNGILFIAG